MNKLIPIERIEARIHLIRGLKVMLDKDLAELYGVDNRQLKRQVRRNLERFPHDFMFVLTESEINDMVCQFGTPSKSYFGGSLPFAFTEHGILMLSSVLNSKKAIQVNIQIMRTFLKLRQALVTRRELRRELVYLEGKYDSKFRVVFEAIKRLLDPFKADKPKIGFVRHKER